MKCYVFYYIILAFCEYVMIMVKVKENKIVFKLIMVMKLDRLYDRCNFFWYYLGIIN